MDSSRRFSWPVRPASPVSQTLCGKNWRFTVLSPHLLRLEWAEDGVFEDRASQIAFYRDFAAGEFSVNEEGGILTLSTDALTLTYQKDMPFSEDTLSIRLLCEPGSVWHFGEEFEDLGGTARTLDEVDGRCDMGRGICSRNGFSVLDDSGSLLLDEKGEIAVRKEGSRDVYFFGHGLDYRAAVKDLYRLTGAPPLLPAYALGNWWSRYYDYSQSEYLSLMDRFREESIPFSVGVVDMDWHVVDIPEEHKGDDTRFQTGWTGYSWNKELFPDHRAFLKELHEKGLKTALNLHPAEGVGSHEDMYKEYALARGFDPAEGKVVPIDVINYNAMAAYFDILHHPYEEDGVDFWWMDWQQGTDYWWIHEANKPGEYQDPRERMDPLWILNHLHILDINRHGKRPMFFSRYAGPGSHRYPVGFSGDTTVTWESLKFQPEFTATASNIGYSWWSHDIGGHMWGTRDPELYLRWLQLGVFSPINRLHSTKHPFAGKEPWNYPGMEEAAKSWLRLRHRLFPYLYAMNYRNHNELLPLVQPMYYAYPKNQAAYEVKTQFLFGSELMVSPITEKSGSDTGLGCAEVWLPKGVWFDLFAGDIYRSLSGRKLQVYRPVSEMPVFAKAGAIVPFYHCEEADNSLRPSEKLEVLVFPGADGSFTLIEDAGDGTEWQNGEICRTEMALDWSGSAASFTVKAAEGERSLIPARRFWRVGFRAFDLGAEIEVTVGGNAAKAETELDKAHNTIWLTVEADSAEDILISLKGEALMGENQDVDGRIEAVIRHSNMRFEDKAAMLKILQDKTSSLRRRKGLLKGNLFPAAGRVLELLCLEDDPYTGSQK